MALTKENVKTVLQSIFVVPFVAGNAVPYDEFHAGSQETDGSLSSTVTIACLTAVSFVIIGVYSDRADTDRNARYLIWGLNFLLISLGMIALGLISVLAYKNRSSWLAGSSRGQRDWNLKTKFLWLFGLAVLLDTSLNMASNIQCISEKKFTRYHVAFASQDLVYIIFFSVQLGFLTYFRHFQFESSVRINYGILIVLLVNLCLWFNAMISDADVESRNYYQNLTNEANSTAFEMQCMFNSTIRQFRIKIMRYLVPARIEAALLSTSFLLSMWPSIRNNAIFAMQPMSSQEFSVEDERQPLLRSPNIQERRTNRARRHPAAFFASLLFGTSINIILVVSTLVFVFAFNNADEKRRDMYPAWLSILISYKFTMLILVAIVFRIFAKHGEETESETSLSAPEYILIFSSAGAAASYTFSFIAGLQIPETENAVKGLTLADNALDIVAKYLQTIMIISFKDTIMRKNTGFLSLEYMYLLLSVANFVMWCGNSFVSVNVREMDLPGVAPGGLFGKDSKITSFNKYVLNPIIIFYDFHASMDLFEMYRKTRQG